MCGPRASARAVAGVGPAAPIDVVRATAVAGSGHPTSALVGRRPDGRAPRGPPPLRLHRAIPSRQRPSHLLQRPCSAPLLYAMFKAAGAISDEELLTLRQRASRLGGPSTPRACPGWMWPPGRSARAYRWPSASHSGSPARGSALTRIWVLCGDGELAEGSMWEAFERAGARPSRQPHRDHRRQRPGTERRHHVRRRPWQDRRQSPRLRLARDRDRRPRRPADRQGLCRGWGPPSRRPSRSWLGR